MAAVGLEVLAERKVESGKLFWAQPIRCEWAGSSLTRPRERGRQRERERLPPPPTPTYWARGWCGSGVGGHGAVLVVTLTHRELKVAKDFRVQRIILLHREDECQGDLVSR